MDRRGVRPGPDASRAFDLGVRSALVVAIGAVAGLYWVGALRLLEVAFALFMLPVYYIVVACLFSVWLGYHEHASTRVYRAASRDR